MTMCLMTNHELLSRTPVNLKNLYAALISGQESDFNKAQQMIAKRTLNAQETDFQLNYPMLCIAAEHGHAPLVELLIHGGQIVLNQANHLLESPLYLAAREGHLDIVSILIEAGADLNQVDCIGLTPLHIAAQRGHLAIVSRLLEQENIHVNTVTPTGDTPLKAAIQNNHEPITQVLTQAGATH